MTKDVAVGAPPARARRLDERVSFDDFLQVRSDALLRTAYLLTHDHGLAEDLVQTALAKAWRSWRRIEGSHEAYVRKILVTTYASWWQRRWRGEVPAETVPEAASRDSDGAPAVDLRLDLRTALARLPRKQRAVVVLRYYEGLSLAETAAVLGCSVGTVKSQTNRALSKLRVDPALSEQDGEQPAETDGPHDAPEGGTR
jgi:RNA polymerase sigma-70 factor (sigma-E family)